MAQLASDWDDFNRAALLRPPRELLRRTLACIELDGGQPGVAVDLGAGAGPDTVELLRRGWTVHAVDADENGFEMLRSRLEAATLPLPHFHVTRFEAFNLPSCDLVWASWSLPYCPAVAWPPLLRRITGALRPGGRFAGDLFRPPPCLERGARRLYDRQVGPARSTRRGLQDRGFRHRGRLPRRR